tara:strand:- start:1283 stop:1582 length:300 start_codon:yes stop_codon:yes gene_type:complete
MKLDIDNIESVVMDSELTRKFKELNVFNSKRVEIDGVLYAVGYEERVSYSRRYHKIALFGAYASMTFHDSNVVDANITHKLSDLVEEVKHLVNIIAKEL